MSTKTKKKVKTSPPTNSGELSDSQLKAVAGGVTAVARLGGPEQLKKNVSRVEDTSELIVSAGPGAGPHV